MSDYISDIEKEFPPQIQQRIEAGMGCGSCIGKGWLPIIVALDLKLNEISPDYKINQIKEKFGGLRFYAEDILDEGYNLIHEAEDESYKICDVCGDHGTVHRNGWIVTRCNKHQPIH